MVEDEISTREFVELLWREFVCDAEGMKQKKETDAMEIAKRHGVVNEQDALSADRPLVRNAAARILHEFLLRELGERDLTDISGAGVLQDLYDCRVCVNHVAQVFLKGILSERQPGIFGMREKVSRTEAKESVRRLLAPERLARYSIGTEKDWKKAGEQKEPEGHLIRMLSTEEAEALLLERPDGLHLDVRTPWEYEGGHPKGAKNLPLLRLLEHPEDAGEDLERPLLLSCDGGYRSETAARRLAEAGYKRVYYFGWEES